MGPQGTLKNRDQEMISLMEKHGIKPMALKITKNGHPQHPLYVSYEAKAQPLA
jgi:hypothetical protein